MIVGGIFECCSYAYCELIVKFYFQIKFYFNLLVSINLSAMTALIEVIKNKFY